MDITLGEQQTTVEYSANGFMFADSTRSMRKHAVTVIQKYTQVYSDGAVGDNTYWDRRCYWTKRGAERGAKRQEQRTRRGVASGKLLRVYQ